MTVRWRSAVTGGWRNCRYRGIAIIIAAVIVVNVFAVVSEASSSSSSVLTSRRKLQDANETIITKLTLVDVDNDVDLSVLYDASPANPDDAVDVDVVVDVSASSGTLSVRADASLGSESVMFDYDGLAGFTYDNNEPYLLGFGQRNIFQEDGAPTLSRNGPHTVSATPYTRNNGRGDSGPTINVNFTIEGGIPVTCDDDDDDHDNPSGQASTDVPPYVSSSEGTLNGELRLWHKITIGFRGPRTCERNQTLNPFTDYRLDVIFSPEDDQAHDGNETSVSENGSDGGILQITVPGYYAADGNAANTRASSGDVWLVHFAPDRVGTWTWSVSFTQGTNVAQEGTGGVSGGYFDGRTGSFQVQDTDKAGSSRDHRGMGRLRYVNEHHLRFAGTGEWFLKAGADSPENMLAFEDFDNTPDIGGRRKSWSPHQIDHRSGQDPTWANGNGTELVGGACVRTCQS